MLSRYLFPGPPVIIRFSTNLCVWSAEPVWIGICSQCSGNFFWHEVSWLTLVRQAGTGIHLEAFPTTLVERMDGKMRGLVGLIKS